MSYEIGTTVLAVRDGSASSMNVFGEGVYIGDRPMPGSDVIPDDDYQAILAVMNDDDATPVEKTRFVIWYDDMLAAGAESTRTREEMIADIEADRLRPMDERIRELWLGSRSNPCIYLDSGDIVFGFQCWWGPLARFKKQAPLAVHVIVPVPDGNGRWK